MAISDLTGDTNTIEIDGGVCSVTDHLTNWLKDQAFTEVRGDQLGSASQSEDKADNINDLIMQVQQWYMDTTLPEIPNLEDFEVPTNTVITHTVGDAPTFDIVENFPAVPVEPEIGTVDPTLTLGDIPEFTAAEPAFNYPDRPATSQIALPDSPELTPVTMPSEPDYTLPDLPSLYALTLPEVPLIVLPEFSGVAPEAPDGQIDTLVWSESDYTTALIDSMNARLLDFVNGASTGLTPAVEDAIWARMRDRNNVEYARKRDNARRSWSAAGFELPDGFIDARINLAEREVQASQLTASRDVAIEQAKLEIENFRFSFEKAIAIENLLSGLVNNKLNRALDAAKFIIQSSIDELNANVNLFNAKSNLYQVEATVYKTRIEAAIAEIQVYTAQIEAQKAIAMIDETLVKMYTEQVQAVVALFDLYKTRLESVRLIQDGDKIKLEKQRNDLIGFAEQVKQTATNIENYSAVVRGEAEKANVYRTIGDVFNTKMNGYKTLADVRIAEKDFAIKASIDTPLKVMEQRTAIYSEQVKAESSRIGALAQMYDAEIKGYSAYEGNVTERDKLFIDDYSENVKLYLGQIDANTQLAQVKANESVTKATASLESMRALASIQGQITAAQLSQYHVSRTVSASASSGVSQHFGCSSSFSNSVSLNTNVNA